MRLKKKVKRFLWFLLLIILAGGGFYVYKTYYHKEEVKEAKVVNKIDKYGYNLKENKPEEYKKMFEELKEILEADEVDEEAYVKKISEMFVYDFYSLDYKSAKTDIGGVDFVYSEVLPNFLENAEDTYYKYVESNIYNNRKQTLPRVTNIEVGEVTQEGYEYLKESDSEAYKVPVTWEYTDDAFDKYQKEATLYFIHDDIKLSLVELQ